MTAITLKRIDTQLQSFTTNRDKLRDQAHTIAMMIFYHAAPKAISDDCNGTGDCTRASKLVEALPRGWSDLMKMWFTQFTPIRISSDGKIAGYDKKYGKLDAADKLKWWKLEDANTMPFHTLTADGGNGVTKVLELADLIKMAHQLGKRINKIAEDEDDKNVLKPEDKATAMAFASTLTNLELHRVATPAADNADSADEQVAA